MRAFRWLVGICLLGLLWLPTAVACADQDLGGTWDTTAHVSAGPESGQSLAGWLDFSSGAALISGTFQATVQGMAISGVFEGTQSDGRIEGVGVATRSRAYRLTVDATVASDGRQFSGLWSDSDGRSGSYSGVRRSAMLPAAGDSPWGLLIAAWALLGAAVLSRGARVRLA